VTFKTRLAKKGLNLVAEQRFDTGTAGLRMSGGDRRTLTPCGHEAVNNHIHHVSRRQRTRAYHVHLGGVGVRLANNLLHDGPHQAIGLTGNDHLIELNEIHHVGMDSDDFGAFYMGRNPSERGSVLHTIAAELTQLAFDRLDAPPVVVGSRNWITPAAEMENAFFPQPEWILDAIHERILPLKGHRVTGNLTLSELVRRSRAGV